MARIIPLVGAAASFGGSPMQVLEARVSYHATGRTVPSLALKSPLRVADYMRDAVAEHPRQEGMWIIPLDRKNKPLGRALVHLGGRSGVNVDPVSMMLPIVLASATAAIMVHNHPSGSCRPSREDFSVTASFAAACRTMNVVLQDHVILSSSRPGCRPAYHSLRANKPRLFTP